MRLRCHAQAQLAQNLSDTAQLARYLPMHGLVRGLADFNVTADNRTLPIDCTGVHNGPTVFDNCTVCGGALSGTGTRDL
eukprot:SAG22_NODE_3226_length_1845_cov_2.332188_2_plen_79_part_00